MPRKNARPAARKAAARKKAKMEAKPQKKRRASQASDGEMLALMAAGLLEKERP